MTGIAFAATSHHRPTRLNEGFRISQHDLKFGLVGYSRRYLNREHAMFIEKFDLRKIIDKAFESGVLRVWMLDGL
ncbi:MAG: hypothetical protein D4S02_06820 [Rhodocyclaceae bacterium]|nr:MAG: hypothetical protein D4S02_06820 [Rhodocyclaceae bacterium]